MNDQLSNPPAQPFVIGLKPLQADSFLQVDDQLARYRAEKYALYKTHFNKVCRAQPDTHEAQLEIEELIEANVRKYHPTLYDFEDGQALPKDGSVRIERNSTCPIASTALLVQDDLLLMRRIKDQWVLVAASLCFPSSWNLAEKFGKPLEDIHAPVPIEQKMNDRINRIFTALKPETPLWRMNWSLETDGNLRHEKSERSPKKKLHDSVFFRSEYQTLHKLPQSQDVLFTVRIHAHPMEDFLTHAEGTEKIARLHQQYQDMTDAERDYKGINNAHGFIRWLKDKGRIDD